MTAPQDVVILRRLLAREPDRADLRLELARTYLALGRAEEAAAAVASLSLADLEPSDRIRLAWVLGAAGRAGAAVDALAGYPGEASVALELARRCAYAGHWPAAEALYARAARLEPGLFEAHHGRAVALDYLGDFAGAVAVTEAACDLFRDHPEPLGILRFHLAQDHLLLGDLPRGFELLEARFQDPSGPRLPPCPLPSWHGEPLAGRPLLLRWDQGFGDAFMLVRFASRLAKAGHRILLEAPDEAGSLLATAAVEVVAPGIAPPPDALQAPMMSLPHLLGVGLEEVPEPVPYLRVPDTVPSRQALDRALEAAPGRRIGLAWSGNPAHRRTSERDLPPALLAPLQDLPGITWISLQKGPGPRPPLPLVDLGPHLSTFADTAHALGQLDALVTVDTALAHLAGALGLPTFLLLPRLPDWRWMLDREDSPWYPSLRLLRQAEHGRWEPVIARLAMDLIT